MVNPYLLRSCADVRIIPHPLLSGQTAADEESDDLSIDYQDILAADDQKEALLAEKRKLLEKVLDKLEELILLSSQEAVSEAEKEKSLQEDKEMEWNQHFSDDHDDDSIPDNEVLTHLKNDDFERTFSNRHWNGSNIMCY